MGKEIKPRQCPYCSGELEKGVLCGGAGSVFLPDGTNPWLPRFALKKRGGILFPINWAGENPLIAYACRQCKKIIIEYEE